MYNILPDIPSATYLFFFFLSKVNVFILVLGPRYFCIEAMILIRNWLGSIISAFSVLFGSTELMNEPPDVALPIDLTKW